jgi:hypothetical protein
LGGWIVTKSPSGQLVNFDKLGWFAVVFSLISLWLASRVHVREIHHPDQPKPGAS